MQMRVVVYGCCLLVAGALRAQVPTPAESLRTELLRLAVREAEIEADRTDLRHRLTPRVDVSAGFSAGNLLFADPASGTAYLLAKDSYRLSLGLSLSGALDGAAHDRALVLVDRARTALRLAAVVASEGRAANLGRAARRDSIRALASEALRLREEIARYQALLFEQGKCGFDALVRARLSLLKARSGVIVRGMAGDPGRNAP